MHGQSVHQRRGRPPSPQPLRPATGGPGSRALPRSSSAMTPVQHAALVSTTIQPDAGDKDTGVCWSGQQARAGPLLHVLGCLSVAAIPLIACRGCCWPKLCLLAHCSLQMTERHRLSQQAMLCLHAKACRPLGPGCDAGLAEPAPWLSGTIMPVSALLSWHSAHASVPR